MDKDKEKDFLAELDKMIDYLDKQPKAVREETSLDRALKKNRQRRSKKENN